MIFKKLNYYRLRPNNLKKLSNRNTEKYSHQLEYNSDKIKKPIGNVSFRYVLKFRIGNETGRPGRLIRFPEESTSQLDYDKSPPCWHVGQTSP